MKRLNKKGFTLIELLAVIVILAVVMVVTIPSVLNSMASARQKQLENAVHSIEEYVQKNYDICVSKLNSEFSDLQYDSTIFTTSGSDNCVPIVKDDSNTADVDESATIITKAGYNTTDIPSIEITITNNKIEIDKVNDGKKIDSGKFKGAIYPDNGR